MSATILRDFAFRLGFIVDDRDVKKLEDGLKRARAGWDGLTAAARRTALEITGAALLTGGAIAKITADTAAYGDQIAKTARQIGLGVEELQELEFAAKRSGTGLEALRTGIRNLARQADDFGLSTSELIERAADAIQGASSDTERLAIAQRMLGRSGADLIPMLAGGAAGIRALRQEARDLGVVLDADATAAAETFADRMQDVRAILAGARNTIGNALIPVVNDLTSSFVRWYSSNRLVIAQRLERVAQQIGDALRRVGEIVRDVDRLVRDRLGGWEAVLKGTATAAGALYAALLVFRFGGPLIAIGQGLTTATVAVTGLSVGAAGLTVGLTALVGIVGILLQAAALGGLVLLIDDLNTLLTGGDALIGRWIDSFRDGSAEGEAFADMLRDLALLFAQTNAAIGEIGGLVAEVFVTGFSGAAQAASDLADEVGRLLALALQLVGIETPDIFRAIGALARGGQRSAQRLGQGAAESSARLAALRGVERDVGRQISTTSTTSQTANVQVQVDARGRDAPGQTGAEVGFAVDRAIRGAMAGVTP